MDKFPRCLLLLLVWVGAAQGLIRVPQDVDSIQSALDLAMDGDTVLVAPGTWQERLHVGSGRVMLCSNYIFSQDSADIVATILDGQFQGTILSVDMDTESRLELNGLTFTRGQGAYNSVTEDLTGGGVDFVQAGDVYLTNLVFYNNRAPMEGSALLFRDFNYPSTAEFYVNNVNCYNNTPTNMNNLTYNAMVIFYARTIRAKKLRTSLQEPTSYAQFTLTASESLFVDDAVFTGLTDIRCTPIFLSAYDIYNRTRYMELKNINISNNLFEEGGGFAFVQGYNGFCRLKNIRMEDNEFPNGGMQFEFGNYGTYEADSIFICGNQSAKSYALFNTLIPGKMSNLFVIGNHMGSHGRFEPTWPGENPIMQDLSIDGAIFADNVLERSMADPGEYTDGGHLLYLSGITADSLTYRNMRFVNNLHIDPDEYVFEDLFDRPPGPNSGRLIYGFTGIPPDYVELDSCMFIGNRQPNIIPEVEPTDLPGGSIFVGSNIQISSWNSHMSRKVTNIQLIDNDDGGMALGTQGDLLVENVVIINNKRWGISFANRDPSYTTGISNIYITRLLEQESYTSYPYYSCLQNALNFSIRPSHTSFISNITVEGCELPFLIRNAHDYPPLVIRNSMFHQNVVLQFENPNGDQVQFEYCMLPMIRPGIGNFLGIDPLFDDMLGPPWLSPQSPCVDAGDPDPRWNDREDPDNPGFALWPGQGTLRNDIGFTGGPHAALYDTTWSHVPQWEPRQRPQVFTLGAPWPNPFNPVTWIPVTLETPAAFTLAVYNMLGQQVGMLHHGPLHAGTHVFPLDAKSLASGTYIVNMTCARRVQSRAITLLR